MSNGAIWSGLLQGASEGVSEAHERRRQRIKEQLAEAQELSQVAKKRRAEADAVANKIRNAHARFGVSERTLFSAYKAGTLDSYLQMLDSPDLSPEMRESLWKVPESQIDPNENIYEQIERSMGVLDQGLRALPEKNDYTVGNLLYRMLGGDTEGASMDALGGRTVGGYDARALLNMPAPEGLEADTGANFNYDIIKQAELAQKLRGRLPRRGGSDGDDPILTASPNFNRVKEQVRESIYGDVVTNLSSILQNPRADEIIEAGMNTAIVELAQPYLNEDGEIPLDASEEFFAAIEANIPLIQQRIREQAELDLSGGDGESLPSPAEVLDNEPVGFEPIVSVEDRVRELRDENPEITDEEIVRILEEEGYE